MERVAVTIFAGDRKGLLRDVTTVIAEKNINIRYIQHFPLDEEMQLYLELEDVTDVDALQDELGAIKSVISVDVSKPFGQIYGKRIIVIGGGAQVAQVVLGAVSEADRHNIRGERISVDTIPLTGEEKLAEAVRAVGRLHRAAVLVLAGSLMGGEVTEAVKELREDFGIPVISLCRCWYFPSCKNPPPIKHAGIECVSPGDIDIVPLSHHSNSSKSPLEGIHGIPTRPNGCRQYRLTRKDTMNIRM